MAHRATKFSFVAGLTLALVVAAHSGASAQSTYRDGIADGKQIQIRRGISSTNESRGRRITGPES